MAIKLINYKPGAVVEQSFIDAWKRVCSIIVERKEQLLNSSQWMPDQARMGHKVAVYKLKLIRSGKTIAGKGLDYELTRLKQLDYQRLYSDGDYLYGDVATVIMEEVMDRSVFVEDLEKIKSLTIGEPRVSRARGGKRVEGTFILAHYRTVPYRIVVPVSTFVGPETEGIDFIPLGDVTGRHPHHTKDARSIYHPSGVYTCWAQFGAPVNMCLEEGDVVDLFRFLRIFVGRYYPGSPLNSSFLDQFTREPTYADRLRR